MISSFFSPKNLSSMARENSKVSSFRIVYSSCKSSKLDLLTPLSANPPRALTLNTSGSTFLNPSSSANACGYFSAEGFSSSNPRKAEELMVGL